MTDREVDRVLREKYRGGKAAPPWNPNHPSRHPREARKAKLRMRFKDARLDAEIERTRDKLILLQEIKREETRRT